MTSALYVWVEDDGTLCWAQHAFFQIKGYFMVLADDLHRLVRHKLSLIGARAFLQQFSSHILLGRIIGLRSDKASSQGNVNYGFHLAFCVVATYS